MEKPLPPPPPVAVVVFRVFCLVWFAARVFFLHSASNAAKRYPVASVYIWAGTRRWRDGSDNASEECVAVAARPTGMEGGREETHTLRPTASLIN